MNVYDICKKQVVSLESNRTIEEAIILMRNKHVGSVCITDNNRPVGMVTDRDVVIKVIAKKVEINTIDLEDLMSRDVLSFIQNEDVYTAIQKMAKRGVRRAPIIDADGHLIGIVSVDDCLEYLANEMSSIVSLIKNEQVKEQHKISSCEVV